MTIAGAASTPADFRYWRKSVHNTIAYRRRRSRWWRSVGIWAWWSGADLCGIIELGSITSTEFVSALRRHGEVRLRPVDIENARTEVYAAAMSVSALAGMGAAGRYQSLKIAIEPVTVTLCAIPIVGSMRIEALPVIV